MNTLPSSAAHGCTATAGAALKQCDGSRVVVVIPELGREPLRGAARYERDDLLGNVLRISLEGDLPGDPHILLNEDEWNGLITPDTKYGCDFCVTRLPVAD